jgi:hypothetical protein
MRAFSGSSIFTAAFLIASVIAPALKAESDPQEALTLLKVAPLRQATSALGVMWASPLDNVPPDAGHQDFEDAGIKWYRSWWQWKDLEVGKPGNYAFPPKLETHLQSLRKHGITPYVTLLYGNPLYGTPGECKFKEDSAKGRNFLDPEAFGNFCARAAALYHPLVRYYEIGNEPHNFAFGNGGGKCYFCGNSWTGNKWASHFAAYFNRASERIKAIQPNAKIIGPGDDGLEAMKAYLPLIRDHVDILAIHPYVDHLEGAEPTPEGSYARRVRPFLELARANGIGEVWITEVGWQTRDEKGLACTNDAQSGRITTELGQAKYLLRGMFFYPIECGIKVYTQFAWENSGETMHDIRPRHQAALKNLRRIFAGAAEDPSLDRFKGAQAAVDFLDPRQAALGQKVMQYLLASAGKSAFYVSWLKLRNDDGFAKPAVRIRLSLPKAGKVAKVEYFDVLKSAGGTAVPFEQSGADVRIRDTRIADYPLLWRITLQ